MDVWQREGDLQPLPERLVTCSICGISSLSATLATLGEPFEFARIYFWIADIGDDRDPSFRDTIESILGPCREHIAWET